MAGVTPITCPLTALFIEYLVASFELSDYFSVMRNIHQDTFRANERRFAHA